MCVREGGRKGREGRGRGWKEVNVGGMKAGEEGREVVGQANGGRRGGKEKGKVGR